MRKEFVVAETKEEAKDLCYWATVVEKVDGGFIAWESIKDYTVWCNQS